MSVLFWLLACDLPAEPTVCEEASLLLHECGVSLPFLDGTACIGTRVNVADCVLENADTCADVAELNQHFEQCLSDVAGAGDAVIDDTPIYIDLGDDTGVIVEETTDALCSDGLDNDGDGTVDCGDPDCQDAPGVTLC